MFSMFSRPWSCRIFSDLSQLHSCSSANFQCYLNRSQHWMQLQHLKAAVSQSSERHQQDRQAKLVERQRRTFLCCSFCLLPSFLCCCSELDRKAIMPRSTFPLTDRTWGMDLRPSRLWNTDGSQCKSDRRWATKPQTEVCTYKIHLF